MKKIFSSYKVFTPKLYRYWVIYAGTVFFAIYTAFVSHSTGALISMLMTIGTFISMDIFTDFFVFQGIFSKDFDFGILKNSKEGIRVLKAGVIGDQIRRFLQTTVVMTVSGLCTWNYSVEHGFINDPVKYAMAILVMILTMYSCNTLVLNVTRRHINYADGLLTNMLSLTLNTAISALVMRLYMKEDSTDPIPMLLVMAAIAVIVTYCMVERIGNIFLLSFGEKKMGRFGNDNAKKMWIFLFIAFGIDFLMIPVMYVGFKKEADLSVFLVAQMMYPACGVVLAKLLSYNEGKLPKFAYGTILGAGLLSIICAVICAVAPKTIEASGQTMTVQYLASTYVMIVGSILMIIALSVTGKEQRENAGFRFHNAGKSLLFMLLFFVLYFARIIILTVIGGIMEGNLSECIAELGQIFVGEGQFAIWISVVINAPLTFLMFLGEEYGWRYFLQPVMQKKFGVLPGTILLGIAWGVWHVGADFMFYSDGTGIQMLCAQFVTCVSLGIFFAYAYMKTNNIWVPVMMHFMNNNLIMVLTGDMSTQSMQGNVVTWGDIPLMIIGAAVFWVFAFTPTMRGKAVLDKTESEKKEIVENA